MFILQIVAPQINAKTHIVAFFLHKNVIIVLREGNLRSTQIVVLYKNSGHVPK